jgi:hypothetical protein
MNAGSSLIALNVEGDWPTCFYHPEKPCGAPGHDELGRLGWHIASLCDCPSCPIRCAIREARVKALGE